MELKPFIEKNRPVLKSVEKQMATFDFNSSANAQKEYQELSREHQRLSKLLKTWDELEQSRSGLEEAREMLEVETDEEMLEVVHEEIEELNTSIPKLETRIKTLILPPDPIENRNTIVEIRPAAGGDEAGLFAGDLFRMYTRLAEHKGWKSEILELDENDVGGIKNVSFTLQGEGIFRLMRFESGVHRVQRIPSTESGGRIHTSTVTVAVLPEAEEVDIHINPSDLRFDVFRSSGPGGQCVNTTDSAVRITHIPTGLNVASQQEKSQHRNREIAMLILRSRLLEAKQEEEAAKQSAERRSQVGTGDRSERIRTYNFPQSRVTDHRYGLTRHDLANILEGNIDDLLNEIVAIDAEQRLKEELEKTSNS